MLKRYDILFLDMNNTFMFEADRFSPEQPYHQVYQANGGTTLSSEEVHRNITECYDIIMEAYVDPARSESFPQVEGTLLDMGVAEEEVKPLEATFAHFEHGQVSAEYVQCLQQLSQHFPLGLICNLWAPKRYWQAYLEKTGVTPLLDVMVFSSDYNFMKPSPKIFEVGLRHFQAEPSQVVHIGDSYHHDVMGAHNVGMDSIWIRHEQTLPQGPPPTYTVPNLLSLLQHL